MHDFTCPAHSMNGSSNRFCTKIKIATLNAFFVCLAKLWFICEEREFTSIKTGKKNLWKPHSSTSTSDWIMRNCENTQTFVSTIFFCNTFHCLFFSSLCCLVLCCGFCVSSYTDDCVCSTLLWFSLDGRHLDSTLTRTKNEYISLQTIPTHTHGWSMNFVRYEVGSNIWNKWHWIYFDVQLVEFWQSRTHTIT